MALTTLAYLPVLDNGFIWDDDDYVTDNPTLSSLAGLGRIWFEHGATIQYYPLTFSTFWIEHQLWGLAPLGYHAVNLVFHLATAFVLWRIFAGWWSVRAAWLVAALFALHPLHVESVAWVTERKNVLSGVLYLASADLYLRGSGLLDAARRAAPRYWYAFSLVLFAAALLSKTVAVTLPPALLLVTWWRRGVIGRDDIVRVLPYFGLSLALGLVTVFTESTHVRGAGFDFSLSPLQRLAVAGSALWFYAGKLAWPHPLIFLYPRWSIDDPTTLHLLLSLPVAALLVIAALFLLRGRIGRGPLCAVLFFAGSLVPALGFFDVYLMRFSFVADHFCYLASIGLLALGVGAVGAIPMPPPARIALASAVLAIFSVLTWSRTHVYANAETLWRDTVAQNPTAWIAHNNLAVILMERGEVDAAEAELQETLRLKPDLDDAHNNLGTIARQRGDLAGATEHFAEAVRITPTFAAALVNLASALQAQGRLTEAIPRYREALASGQRDRRIRGSLAVIHANLAIALDATGDVPGALPHYREALRLDPNLAIVRDRLVVLQQAGVAGTAAD